MSAPGIAEPQLGPAHRDWYSRGYLPHCDHPGLLQAITYRLADSLPTAVLEQLDAELRNLPPERRKRIEAWLDAGHGCCVLREPEAAACVVDTWRHFSGVRYDLIAWVVMPNHVHLLIRTYEGVALGKIVQSWKSYTSRQVRRMMEDTDRAGDLPAQGLWMREYWDRYIRNERHFQAAVAYIHQNPVKAGLVKVPTDWPWSSAHECAELAEPALGDPGGDHPGWVVFRPHPAAASETVDVPINVRINVRQRWFLDQLSGGMPVKAREIAEHFQVVEKTARRDIAGLQSKQLVEFVGPPKTGFYRIREQT